MDIRLRPLDKQDLSEADRIFRLAFGTFLGLPDPLAFGGDADYVNTRWHAAPHATLGAYAGRELLGSNFATHWGSFGFFGPLTVRPDLWEKGVARRLLDGTMQLFDDWGVRHSALFTFAHSPKHVALYQKYGYWSQHLTAVMALPVERADGICPVATFGGLPDAQRPACLEACRGLADAVYPGLDLGREIEAVARQDLGDTVLVHEGEELAAFAICHLGAGSEAGSGSAFVKFGAARPGIDAPERFDSLLCACQALAAVRGARQLVAGVNTARHGAYRRMIARGFRTQMQGVAMQRHNEPGYNRDDCFVIDDWR